MRLVQRAGHLGDQRHRAGRFERGLLCEQRAQIGALDIAHRHVEDPVLLPCVEDLDGVRVVDRRSGAALMLEARTEDRVERGVGGDQLERDRPVQREVDRPEHHAHAAAPGQRVDAQPRERVPDCQLLRHLPPFERVSRASASRVRSACPPAPTSALTLHAAPGCTASLTGWAQSTGSWSWRARRAVGHGCARVPLNGAA